MLWKETTQLGCATIRVDGTIDDFFGPLPIVDEYSICRYASPGNVDGQYIDQVKPLVIAF